MNTLHLAIQAAAAAYALYKAMLQSSARTPEHLAAVSAAADAAARMMAFYQTMRDQAARTHELTDAEGVVLDGWANEAFAAASANKSGR